MVLKSGAAGRAAVPSGASTGEFEAVELRDGGEAWSGKGVSAGGRQRERRARRARCAGSTPPTRPAVDRAMIDLDGTPNKGRLGANAILGVSLAAAKAAAAEAGLPLWRYLGGEAAHVLPVPMMNVLNGGAHADNKVDFQEFMVVPVGARQLRRGACAPAPRSSTRSSGRCTTRGLATAVGDEGGFAPDLDSNEAALEALIAGIEAAGYRPGDDVAIALDPATSELYDDGAYVLEHEGRTLLGRGAGRLLGRHLVALPGALDRGRHGRGGLGRLEGADRADRRPRAARGRRPVRDQHRAPAARHRLRRGQLDPGQGQPDRDAHRDARRGAHRPARPATRRSCRTAPARPRTPRSPTSRWPPAAARSRPARRRARTGWRSTTSCCGSRRRWGRTPTYPGRSAFRS